MSSSSDAITTLAALPMGELSFGGLFVIPMLMYHITNKWTNFLPSPALAKPEILQGYKKVNVSNV